MEGEEVGSDRQGPGHIGPWKPWKGIWISLGYFPSLSSPDQRRLQLLCGGEITRWESGGENTSKEAAAGCWMKVWMQDVFWIKVSCIANRTDQSLKKREQG